VSGAALALSAAGSVGVRQVVTRRVGRRPEQEREESVQEKRDERESGQKTDRVESAQKVASTEIIKLL